ncbi:hypothetical protein [Deefgea rivuli]|uniref:hypothetical protein n=1 Tax=Deefgea rivuli TaxID=400948 RepID=UPI000484446A|nr:hypothetical protein [Deefgea rivuli]
MEKIINHKLFEIFFEKLLIALILVLAGYVANQSIERYKLIEAQRVAGTVAFVESCQEIWIALYQYEAELDRSEAFATRVKFAEMTSQDASKENAEFKEANQKIDEKLRNITDKINAKSFIVGAAFVEHFRLYASLVKARADAKNSAVMKFNKEATIAREAVESFDRQIASMRFTADMAREYAIRRLPQP